MKSLYDFFVEVNSPEVDEPGKEHTHLKDRLNTLILSIEQSNSDIDLLDVGCGTGILPFAVNNANPKICKKIDYIGIDGNNSYIARCKNHSDQYNWKDSFKHTTFILGDFFDFPFSNKFDYIILANCLHEISPLQYFELFCKIRDLLKTDGKTFIFDMESPPSPEITALPWTKNEIERLLNEGLSLNTNFTQEKMFKTNIWYSMIPRNCYDKISDGNYYKILKAVCEDKRKKYSIELSNLIQDIQFEIHKNRFFPTDSNDLRIMEISFKWILISNLTEVIENMSSGTIKTRSRFIGMDEW